MPTMTVAPPSCERISDRPDVLVLAPVRATAGVQPILLDRPRCLIGSGPGSDVRLEVPGIAAAHCVVLKGPTRRILKALDHRTWVNETPVREVLLRAGSRVAIGPIEFRLRPATPDELLNSLSDLIDDNRPARSVVPAPVVAPLAPTAPLVPSAGTVSLGSAVAAVSSREKTEPQTDDAGAAAAARLKHELQKQLARVEIDINRQTSLLAQLCRRARRSAPQPNPAQPALAESPAVARDHARRERRLHDLQVELSAHAEQLLLREANLQAGLKCVAADAARQQDERRTLDSRAAQLARSAANLCEQQAELDRHERDLAARHRELAAREEACRLQVTAAAATAANAAAEQQRVQAEHDRCVARRHELDQFERVLAARSVECAAREADLRRQQDELNRATVAAGRERADLVAEMQRLESSRAVLDAEREDFALRSHELAAREAACAAREETSRSQAEENRIERNAVELEREALHALRQELAERGADWNAAFSDLARRDEALVAREQARAAQDAALRDHSEQLTRGLGELAAAQAILERERAELEARRSELTAALLDVARREQVLAEGQAAKAAGDEAQAAEIRLAADAVARERELLELRRHDLEHQACGVDAVRRELALQLEQAAARQAALAAGEQELHRQRAEFAAQEQAYAERVLQCTEREAALQRAAAALAEREQAHAVQQQAVVECELRLSSWQAELTCLRSELDEARAAHDAERRRLIGDIEEAHRAGELHAAERAELAAFSEVCAADAARLAAEQESLLSGKQALAAARQQLDFERTELEEQRARLAAECDALAAARQIQTDRAARLAAAKLAFASRQLVLLNDDPEPLATALPAPPENPESCTAADQPASIAGESPAEHESSSLAATPPGGPDWSDAIGDLAASLAIPAEVTRCEAVGEPGSDNAAITPLRSVLAEMFGFQSDTPGDQSPAQDNVGPSRTEESRAGDVEMAEAVATSLDATAALIGTSPPSAAPPQPEIVVDADNPESISAYMEQLLARTRRNSPVAGGQETSISERYAAPVVERHSAVESLLPSSPTAEVEVADELAPTADGVEAEPVAMAPRARVNAEELRAGINSLREVANLSARNAVATHTWKKMRGSIFVKLVLSISAVAGASLLFSGVLGDPAQFMIHGWGATVIACLALGALGHSCWRLWFQLHPHECGSAGLSPSATELEPADPAEG